MLSFTDIRDATNLYLGEIMDKRIAEADALSPEYGNLCRTANSLIMSGGKRIRPYLVHLTHQAYGGNADAQAPLIAGAATELLHVALLIHDDITDRDLERRGIKNVTGQYIDEYKGSLNNSEELLHFATSASLLAGDLLIAESYRTLNEISDATPESKQQALRYFSESVFVVCGGQILDIEASFRDNSATAMKIAEYKTASYSFVGPLLTGASLAGAEEREIELLHTLGTSIGIGFQLRDDVIGVFGDKNSTGKTSVGDIREGKRTYMVEKFHDLAKDDDLNEFKKVFGVSGLDDELYQQAAKLLDTSGARQACEDEIKNQGNIASTSIDGLNIDQEYKDALYEIVNLCLKRDK